MKGDALRGGTFPVLLVLPIQSSSQRRAGDSSAFDLHLNTITVSYAFAFEHTKAYASDILGRMYRRRPFR